MYIFVFIYFIFSNFLFFLIFFFSSRFFIALQSKFTSKSDTHSYGVLLWEILTFAREQPFENLTDEKVIENIGHIYQDNKKHVSTLSLFFYNPSTGTNLFVRKNWFSYDSNERRVSAQCVCLCHQQISSISRFEMIECESYVYLCRYDPKQSGKQKAKFC